MKTLLPLALIVFVMLSSVGCSSEPAETTLTIKGLDGFTQAIQNNSMLEQEPSSIQMGDTHILCIPTGVTRDGNFSIQYKFFEWIDGKLKQIEFAQPTSE